MTVGRIAAEGKVIQDARTGLEIRQVTDHPAIHHHPFYYVPPYDDAMKRLFFVSHRTGRPELWCEVRSSGELQQLTDQSDIAEWSVYPSHDGRYVYFTAGSGGWRVSTNTLVTEQLVEFAGPEGRAPGMVGAAMGTTALSHDDRYWAVSVWTGTMHRLLIVDTLNGKHETIVEGDSVGHPEFHPADNSLLRYAGPYDRRIWVIGRDGTGNRLVYNRNLSEWIVHETWRPRSPGDDQLPLREIITTRWPHGCIGIDIDSGAVRAVCSFNAWHPCINRQGTQMCADTTFPDRGLQLFDPCDGIGEPSVLCYPESTNQGEHWNTDHCPYDDDDYRHGRLKVYAPQHTHPHPAFSPDGKMIVFTSDRSGHSQVYEVRIPPEQPVGRHDTA